MNFASSVLRRLEYQWRASQDYPVLTAASAADLLAGLIAIMEPLSGGVFSDVAMVSLCAAGLVGAMAAVLTIPSGSAARLTALEVGGGSLALAGIALERLDAPGWVTSAATVLGVGMLILGVGALFRLTPPVTNKN